jgi:hypothetical protein
VKTKIKIEATIPTRQYENIRPSIELEGDNEKEMSEYAESWVYNFVNKYSEHGPLQLKMPPSIEGIKSVLRKTELLKSFNENVVVEFEPIEHVYSIGWTRLTGVTDYIKRFFKPFDAPAVAAQCAKSWGVESSDIQKMWADNGEATSSFGTAIHKALEYYLIYREQGEVIRFKRGMEIDDNPAMPKHPILKKIIEEFLACYKIPKDYELVMEAFITDHKSGICGRADRLLVNRDKKTCRVQDYKVNFGAEEKNRNNAVLAPFDHLPPNKLSKYQLQMSVYANMLERSGWSVEGVDAFVYDEKWTYYPMEVLKVY